jgi:hypothetical protein
MTLFVFFFLPETKGVPVERIHVSCPNIFVWAGVGDPGLLSERKHQVQFLVLASGCRQSPLLPLSLLPTPTPRSSLPSTGSGASGWGPLRKT